MAVYLKNRRLFIKHLSSIGVGVGMGQHIFSTPDQTSGPDSELVILHTNDVHSHIHPYDSEHPRYANRGGVIRRSALIDKIRKENKHVLLLDAGDIFQGTPFFNFYKGELEMKLMSLMKYDAITLGNHDFDAGISGFMNAFKHGKFDVLVSNYLFENDLEKVAKPYKIFKKGKIRIGVFGIGIELDGLVDPDLYKGTIYTDPVIAANSQARYLKNYKNCDLVICLSHLGLKYKDDRISDVRLARNTQDIDVIIGGHTHSFLDEAISEINQEGDPVLISQAAWSGLRLGMIKISLNKKSKIIQGSSQKI